MEYREHKSKASSVPTSIDMAGGIQGATVPSSTAGLGSNAMHLSNANNFMGQGATSLLASSQPQPAQSSGSLTAQYGIHTQPIDSKYNSMVSGASQFKDQSSGPFNTEPSQVGYNSNVLSTRQTPGADSNQFGNAPSTIGPLSGQNDQISNATNQIQGSTIDSALAAGGGALAGGALGSALATNQNQHEGESIQRRVPPQYNNSAQFNTGNAEQPTNLQYGQSSTPAQLNTRNAEQPTNLQYGQTSDPAQYNDLANSSQQGSIVPQSTALDTLDPRQNMSGMVQTHQQSQPVSQQFPEAAGLRRLDSQMSQGGSSFGGVTSHVSHS